MSHFLLSQRSGRQGGPLDGRYGVEALTLMLTELGQKGVLPSDCEAKIFGGGNMFPTQIGRDGATGHVGRKNGEAARQMLEEHGIRVCSESLFGVGHRKIVFDVSSGHVWSQQVRPAVPPSFTRRTKA